MIKNKIALLITLVLLVAQNYLAFLHKVPINLILNIDLIMFFFIFITILSMNYALKHMKSNASFIFLAIIGIKMTIAGFCINALNLNDILNKNQLLILLSSYFLTLFYSVNYISQKLNR